MDIVKASIVATCNGHARATDVSTSRAPWIQERQFHNVEGLTILVQGLSNRRVVIILTAFLRDSAGFLLPSPRGSFNVRIRRIFVLAVNAENKAAAISKNHWLGWGWVGVGVGLGGRWSKWLCCSAMGAARNEGIL